MGQEVENSHQYVSYPMALCYHVTKCLTNLTRIRWCWTWVHGPFHSRRPHCIPSSNAWRKDNEKTFAASLSITRKSIINPQRKKKSKVRSKSISFIIVKHPFIWFKPVMCLSLKPYNKEIERERISTLDKLELYCQHSSGGY